MRWKTVPQMSGYNRKPSITQLPHDCQSAVMILILSILMGQTQTVTSQNGCLSVTQPYNDNDTTVYNYKRR